LVIKDEQEMMMLITLIIQETYNPETMIKEKSSRVIKFSEARKES